MVIQNVRAGVFAPVFAIVAIALGLSGTVSAAPEGPNFARPGRTSTDAVMFRGNAARTGVESGPAPATKPVELWQQTFGDATSTSPIVANGLVYLNSRDEDLYAFDAKTGEEVWRVRTGGVESVPLVANGVVYTGVAYIEEDGGELMALDAETGRQIWTYETKYPIDYSSPVLVDGIVYIGSESYDEVDGGGLHAVNAETGEEVWSVETVTSISSSPAVVDGVVYVGAGTLFTEVTGFYAFDSATGEELWSFLTDYDPIGTAPAVVDGQVYASGFYAFYVLDAETGELVWSKGDGEDDGIYDTAPAVVDGIVYVGGNGLSALDANTGDEVWYYPTTVYVASPVIVDGVVYAGTYGGEVFAFDAEDGQGLWRYAIKVESDVDERYVASSVTIADGVIYFTSYSSEASWNLGALHAIGVAE